MSRINPLMESFDTPPFKDILLEDYIPAIENAISVALENIDTIISNDQPASFENCIVELEFAAHKLDKITPIFFNLNYADTTDEMQEMALAISSILTTFANDVSLNEKLFAKVVYVYNNCNREELDCEQKTLLEETYRGFVREGASLSEDKKIRYREISQQLSQLSLKFSQNILSATNAYHFQITDEKELQGIPKFAREIGKSEAEAKGLDGWVYTLSAQSYIPFMQFADNREQRELLWSKYNTRCFDNSEFDNQALLLEIANLRCELSILLGYKNFAEYALDIRMSKTQQITETFIEELVEKTKPFAEKDWSDVEQYAKDNGFEGDLMPWDFSYYAEKYKSMKYQISDDKLKPYFKLENVYNGLFDVINRLYSIEFKENTIIDKYHTDVVIYDVIENGKIISILYMDFFPRDSKSSGAWMTSYKDKMNYLGEDTTPIISIVCNFTKPTTSSPSLLTYNEVTTLFHEAGHALHGIFAKGKYPSINGTNVARDFVELPSQIMENWASDNYFLTSWAKHYQTSEPIPQDYIKKIKESENFLSGYSQIRQLLFATNDMAWHTIEENINVKVKEFESNAIKNVQITPFIENSSVSTTFSHIFAGGYAAGYYSYKWAEVLEADAFSKFMELGVYDKECADRFKNEILTQGSHRDAMELYVNFMGRAPQSDALFKKLGLNK